MIGWLGFEARVAVRFLREGRMQTVLIIVGVAAGVAVVAYISALISGLQRNTLEKTLGAQAHLTRQRARRRGDSGPCRRCRAARRWCRPSHACSARAASATGSRSCRCSRRLPLVAAVSPMVSGAGLAQRGEATKSIALMGVDLDRYDRIVHLRSKVVQGEARLGPGEGIIGRELADDLGVRVGDRISLVTGGSTDSLRVTALVDLGVRELNRRTVIVPAARGAEPGRSARRRHRARPGAGRRLGGENARRRAGAAPALQGRELAGGERAAGFRAERTVGEHGADPRRRDGRGGARHRQRAGGLGGAEAARDRHPARHRRHARADAARLPAAGGDRRRARLDCSASCSRSG
jgi:hypothetical protein